MGRFRTRLPELLSVWAGAAAVEAILYYFFLSRPYFRGFFLPFAIAIAVVAVAATWRLLRGRRHPDRRSRERRLIARREAGRGAGE
jgi:hypothetical protein